jgi:hypothetical protein
MENKKIAEKEAMPLTSGCAAMRSRSSIVFMVPWRALQIHVDPGGPKAPSPTSNQSYKKKQHNGTGKCGNERPNPFVAKRDMEHAEQPTAQHGSEHADNHIAYEAKTASLDDQTG